MGVFKPFSKACSSYLAKYPGHMILSVVATAWPNAFTPKDIMAGFRKTGVFSMNLGSIDDKMLSPSEAFKSHKPLHDQMHILS